MHFRSVNNSLHQVIFSPWVLLLLSGCSLPGVVVNHEQFETVLTTMKLGEYPALKVYYGGSIREVSLKDVKLITIDPSEKLNYDNELYYSADITLKNGSVIISTERDKTKRTKAFVSIQNTLSGKQNNESFKIDLGSVSRIEVHK